MGAVNWERWARAAGIGFVVLTVAAFIAGGEAPTVTDSTEELVSYYDGDRGQVLVSSLLFALGPLTGIGASLAYSIAGQGDAGVVKTLFDLQWAIDLFAAFPSAGFFLAASVGLMRARVIPARFGWGGIAAAVLFLLRSTNWAREGFWSPTGGFVFILILVALFWILTTSVFLFRKAPATTVTAELPPTPPPSAIAK